MDNWSGTKAVAKLNADMIERDYPEFMRCLVYEAALGIVQMKQTIGAAHMNFMTKCMEFVMVVYGTPRTQLMVIIMYVCQECGWCPRYDYDYFVVTKCGTAS